MDRQLIKTGIWSRAIPSMKARVGSIKIYNPFVGAKPFTPSYEKEQRADMNRLYHNDYQRVWTQEREEYLRENLPKRKDEIPKKKFPIYRKVSKIQCEIKPDSSKLTNKKYANVKPKVETYLPKKDSNCSS